MRYALLTFLLIAISTPLRPCSCVAPTYESLCEVIDNARSDGENIVLVRVVAKSDRFVELTIERELVGAAPFQAFTFRRGNGADCGISLAGAKVGDRFLGHFAFTAERQEYGATICGYRYKMLPIRDGAVEYPSDRLGAAPGAGPFFRYFDLNALISSGDCVPFGGSTDLRSGLAIGPNPTGGTVRLDTLQAIPIVYRMELFDLSGRPLRSWSGPLVFPYELDFTALPAGVYFLRVFADPQRQVFRIVKT